MKLSAPIHALKKQAKDLKKTRAIQLAEALDLIARREGYNSWSLLQSKTGDILPDTYSHILSYLKPADLVLIGGRPAMGKTSFAIGMVAQALADIPAKHFIFSLDLIRRDVVKRIRDYDATVSESDERLTIDCSDEICARYIIKQTKEEVSSGSVIVVDYLQLLDQRRSNAPVQEQVQELKDFAKDKGCTVIFLSQIMREIELKADRRPTIEDIKIVNPMDLQNFNKIILLYKEEERPDQVEVVFAKPRKHAFTANWDADRRKFVR
ncbi:MAG: DNA helicase [Alphaproteobacteria bacterium]